jgi:site-specific recombinase XerD
MRKNVNDAVWFSRTIGDWIVSYLPAQKVCSEKTIESYEFAMALYLHFLEEEKQVKKMDLIPNTFCKENIETWLCWLSSKRCCCADTCNNRLSSIRSFLKFVSRQKPSLGYLYTEAMQIPFRKTTKRTVTGISKEAMATLLSTPNQNTRTGRRDLAIFCLMYDTATRIDEILSLQVRNVNLQGKRPSITVMGKGEKLRTLPLMPRTTRHLHRYLEEFHGNNPGPNSFLFFSRNTGLNGKLSQNAVNKQLKKYAMEAHQCCKDVPLDLHSHQLSYPNLLSFLTF